MNASSQKECHAQPFALDNIYYKPTKEEMEKYCQTRSDEGFSYCPRFRAYQDHLEYRGKKPSEKKKNPLK